MLFGPCVEGSVAPFLSAGALCSGGAGFVSAVIATLAASAKTAPAKSLGNAVPQVDRLAVRMVTDNIVIQFIPTEKRDGLTIERKSGNTSPDKPPRTILNGEWGLAMHAQSFVGADERNVLIDFGYTPEVLVNNLSILKIDPSTFDALVLSHGHYDHFGGMVGFLNATKGALKAKMPLYVGGEDTFCLRRNPGGNFGALDRKAILDADLTLMMATEPAIVPTTPSPPDASGRPRSRRRCGRPMRSSAFSTASAASRRKCRRKRTSANISPTISSTNSPPSTWSRTRAWWCSRHAAIAA
jgi:7,8-dihydropterin-6-yl-methyl-4-(beta-D-ribofuranosyl)aminobenzene 5'-phosphate synthase